MLHHLNRAYSAVKTGVRSVFSGGYGLIKRFTQSTVNFFKSFFRPLSEREVSERIRKNTQQTTQKLVEKLGEEIYTSVPKIKNLDLCLKVSNLVTPMVTDSVGKDGKIRELTAIKRAFEDIFLTKENNQENLTKEKKGELIEAFKARVKLLTTSTKDINITVIN